MDTVIGQVTHTLTINSPVTDMMIKSILKKLVSAKAKACVASAAIPVTTGDMTITSPTPAITTAIVQQHQKGSGQPLQ